MDRGAWWAMAYRVAKSQIWLKQLSTHAHNTLPHTWGFHKHFLPSVLLLWELTHFLKSLNSPHKHLFFLAALPSNLKYLLHPWGFSVRLSSVAQSYPAATPWTAVHQASLSITNSWSPPKPMFIVSVMPSNHLILCHPLLLLPSIFPSIRVFSNDSALCIRWPEYWSFSFNINPSNEHSGLISFRMDSLDLLAVQGTLKSFLQHHSSKASILRCSAFFTVQLSHPCMTTGKTIALTRWNFFGKVMSLFFNIRSRSKCLLISWLQSPSAVILEPRKIVSHSFHCFPIYLPWSDGTGYFGL